MRRLLLLGCVLALSACAGVDTTEPPAPLVQFNPTLKVEKAWSHGSFSDAEGLLLALRPASDGVHVFAAGHDGEVDAWDLKTGRSVWSRDLDMPLAAGPSVAEGVVLVGSNEGQVVALQASDGKQLWSVQLGGEVLAAPALSGQTVVVRTVDGHLTALSLADGRQIWSVEQSVPSLSLRGTAAPIIQAGVVYDGFDNGKLAAYALSDGELQWETPVASPGGRTEIERLVDVDGTPVLRDNDIYVTAVHGRVAAVAAESGQVIWAENMSSDAGLGVDSQAVYVTDDNSLVHALDRNGGATLWSQEKLRARDLTAPTPFGPTVVVGDLEGYLHFLDRRNGRMMARVQIDNSAIVTPPVVAGDMLVAMTESGDIAAYRIKGDNK
ncbi:MAG: outer membrane protein assembly factor BamB [Gammaproteobacteria bacterium]|jgi:outer membrane protein assembly factor BamB